MNVNEGRRSFVGPPAWPVLLTKNGLLGALKEVPACTCLHIHYATSEHTNGLGSSDKNCNKIECKPPGRSNRVDQQSVLSWLNLLFSGPLGIVAFLGHASPAFWLLDLCTCSCSCVGSCLLPGCILSSWAIHWDFSCETNKLAQNSVNMAQGSMYIRETFYVNVKQLSRSETLSQKFL